MPSLKLALKFNKKNHTAYNKSESEVEADTNSQRS